MGAPPRQLYSLCSSLFLAYISAYLQGFPWRDSNVVLADRNLPGRAVRRVGTPQRDRSARSGNGDQSALSHTLGDLTADSPAIAIPL